MPLKHDGSRNRRTALADILFHWENADPDLGLMCALRDWPMEWITGENKPHFAVKYFQRSVIVLEYIDVYVN